MLSCWRDVELEGGSPEGNTHLQICHNYFMYNEAVATKLAPLVRTFGRIEHNDYKHNKDGEHHQEFGRRSVIFSMVIFVQMLLFVFHVCHDYLFFLWNKT